MSGPSRIALQTARGKGPIKQGAEWRKHILLRGATRATTPEDVRRALTRVKCQGVTDVVIDYKQFVPTGVLLTLSHSDYTRSNLDKLKNLSIGGIPVFASPWETRDAPEPFDGQRMRGKEGRKEAVNRGINKPSGDGPHAGLGGSGMNIAIVGLPFDLRISQFVQNLDGYDLRGKDSGQPSVHWAQRHYAEFSPYRTAVIRAASPSEAHRIVRDLHGTTFPWKGPFKYPLKAHIVY